MNHHKHDSNSTIPNVKKRWTDWLPLGVVFSFILLLTFLTMSLTSSTLDNFLTYSMGYFFILFSLFKLLDIRAFVAGYKEYDLISKAWPGWAYMYPFFELWLGALYLSNNASLPIHIITIVISLVTCLSVFLSMRKKEALHCACLGTILKVPLTTISIAEYALMAVMAGFMIISGTSSSMITTEAHRSFDQYSQLYGEEYDKAFLHEMVDHHQGALDMAAFVASRTTRQELVDFAKSIDKVQRAEIAQMQTWQTDWSYHDSHMHDDNTMHDHMNEMSGALEDLTGDEFDKHFLELMIEHHQGALDMAISGETNASHEELRELTRQIVLAQTKEIAQMRQWQLDWGFVN